VNTSARAIVLALAALWATAPATYGQERGAAVLERAAAHYEEVEALCASFLQRLEVPLLGDERTGVGRVCQARPNLFAMRFSEPEGDAIVADGESVWVYFPSNDPGQVLKTKADRTAGGHDFHREFLEETEVKYDVTYEAEDVVAGRPTHRLRLIPKGPASYRAAVIWIDRGEPVLRQVRLEEENGNVRTITLSDVEFNAAPGRAWFTFTLPPDVVVITG
jgi:outer membrane lipoprotein-sorting protein